MVSHLCTGIVLYFIAIRPQQPRAVDLCNRLLPPRAIPQPRDGLKVGSSAFTLAAHLQRRIYVGVQRSRHAIRQYPDDRVRLAFQPNRLPQNIRISAEGIAPQAVTQDRGLRPVWPVFVLRKIAPHYRLNRSTSK